MVMLQRNIKFNINMFLLLIFLSFFSTNVLFASYDVSVIELSNLRSNSERGYIIINFIVDNHSNSNQVIDIKAEIERDYNSSGLVVTKRIELTGKESRVDKISFPIVNRYCKGQVDFYLKGKIIQTIKFSHSGYSNDRSILIDKEITNKDCDKLFKAEDLNYEYRKIKTFYFDSNLDMMDKDWISYFQYHALMFYDKTFEDMPEDVKSAIIDYVKAGGILIIIGNIDIPHGIWDGRAIDYYSAKTTGINKINYVGLGKIYFCNRKLFDLIKTKQKAKSDSGKNHRIKVISKKDFSIGNDDGFGDNISDDFSGNASSNAKDRIIVSGIYNPNDILRELITSFNENSISSRTFVHDSYSEQYVNMASKGLLLFLIILFFIVLGPVNFTILYRLKKRILFFVTVPIISFICCFMIFVYYFIFEYNRLDVFRQSFTLLDEPSNSSITFGDGLVISGKSMNNALVIPNSAAFMLSERNDFSRLERKEIKIDNNQNFNGNWIEAKNPFCYSVISQKIDRSRVEIEEKNQNIEILNGLGANIKFLFYKSKSNKIYEVKSVRAGDKGEGLSIDKFGSFKGNNNIDFYDLFSNYNDETNLVDSMKNYAENSLQPGEYLAWLNSDPFMKQDYDWRAKITELGCFVHGRTKKDVTK